MSFETNPFSWKKENITGTVGSVSLTKMDGTVIPVENLPEEIEVIAFVLGIICYFGMKHYFEVCTENVLDFFLLLQILLPRLDFEMENSTVLDLANFSTLIIDIPSPDVTIVLKMEPSEHISFMLFLGYKDYPNDENYVAKTLIPQENLSEGKSKTTCFAYSAKGLKALWT